MRHETHEYSYKGYERAHVRARLCRGASSERYGTHKRSRGDLASGLWFRARPSSVSFLAHSVHGQSDIRRARI